MNILSNTWKIGGSLKRFQRIFLLVAVAVRICGSMNLLFSAVRDVSVGKIYNVLAHRIKFKYPVFNFSRICSCLACHPLLFNGFLETLFTNYPTPFKIIATVAFRIQSRSKNHCRYLKQKLILYRKSGASKAVRRCRGIKVRETTASVQESSSTGIAGNCR